MPLYTSRSPTCQSFRTHLRNAPSSALSRGLMIVVISVARSDLTTLITTHRYEPNDLDLSQERIALAYEDEVKQCTKHVNNKMWWSSAECDEALELHRKSRERELDPLMTGRHLKKTIRRAKREYFDKVLQETKRPWDRSPTLMALPRTPEWRFDILHTHFLGNNVLVEVPDLSSLVPPRDERPWLPLNTTQRNTGCNPQCEEAISPWKGTTSHGLI